MEKAQEFLMKIEEDQDDILAAATAATVATTATVDTSSSSSDSLQDFHYCGYPAPGLVT
jgi:hypothetical protein